MKKLLIAALVATSSLAFAGDQKDLSPDQRAERHEEGARKKHMMRVVGIADALELNEAEALRLSETMKSFDERRKAVRGSMHESMGSLKRAADGAAGVTQAQVDQDIQRVLDGRAQLAAIDKEMFVKLTTGQTPQKKAKLALFFAKFGEESRHMKGRHHRGQGAGLENQQ